MRDTSTNASSLSNQTPVAPGRLITRNLVVRIATGIVLLPVVLTALFLGGAASTALVLIIMLIAALELNFFITDRRIKLSSILTLIMVTVIGLSRPMLNVMGDNAPRFYAVSIGLGMTFLFTLIYFTSERPHRLRDALIGALGTLFIAHLTLIALILRDSPLGLLFWLILLIGTFAMDSFSYLGGRLLGKHRLAPNISPGKTVEGAVIGAVCAVIIAIAFLVAANMLNAITLIIVLGMPLADLAGDLFESWVKRLYGVKDSYIPWLNIMPGHGGVLDRIDGLSMTLIYIFAVLVLSGYFH